MGFAAPNSKERQKAVKAHGRPVSARARFQLGGHLFAGQICIFGHGQRNLYGDGQGIAGERMDKAAACACQGNAFDALLLLVGAKVAAGDYGQYAGLETDRFAGPAHLALILVDARG